MITFGALVWELDIMIEMLLNLNHLSAYLIHAFITYFWPEIHEADKVLRSLLW